jgi:ClpP class serine protease
VGSIGVVNGWISFNRLLKSQKIEYRKFESNELLLSSRMHDPFDVKDEKVIAQHRITAQELHRNFQEHVKKYRAEKIKKVGTPEKVLDSIYNAECFTGQEAINYGYRLSITILSLADSFGTYQNTLAQLHPGCKLKQITHQPLSEVIKENLISADYLKALVK